MSTYYYLACHRHTEGVPACSSVGGGCPMGDGLDLPAFIYKHQDCSFDLRIVDEHKWGNLREAGYVRYERLP
jgi:hypothetical protein